MQKQRACLRWRVVCTSRACTAFHAATPACRPLCRPSSASEHVPSLSLTRAAAAKRLTAAGSDPNISCP